MTKGFLGRGRIPGWALGLLLLGAAPAAAQSADFLFRKPSVTVTLRGGWAVPRAQSEVFAFTTENLIESGTLDPIEPSDFSSPTFQFEIAAAVQNRLDVVLGVGVSQSSVHSEFAHFVGTDDLPIQQTTDFLRVPITAGVKVYLKDRGRPVSRFAWVPNRWSPYVGAGAGWMYSEFDQSGEFVDYETLDIFRKSFRSSGFAPTAHVGAGVDFSLGPHFLATGEARYLVGKDHMSEDFVGFDRIDLSGFQITAGISLRF